MKANSDAQVSNGETTLRDAAFWMIVVLVAFVPQMSGSNYLDSADLPKLALIQLGSLVVLLLWLVTSARAGRLILQKDAFTFPLLLFLLWAGLSLFWAQYWYAGAERLIHWSACFVFYLVLSHLLESKADIRTLMGAVAVSGLATTLLGLLQSFFAIDWVAQAVPPAAAFANKNVAAQFIVLTLPIVVAFWLNAEKKGWVWLWTPGVALMLLYLFLTRTKAAWLAVSVEAALLVGFLIVNRRRQSWTFPKLRLKLVGLVFCALLIPLAATIARPDFQWPVEEAYGSVMKSLKTLHQGPTPSMVQAGSGETRPAVLRSSLGIRLTLWVNTLAMVKDYPIIGVGLGNFFVYHPLYYRAYLKETHRLDRHHVMRAHNDLVQVLAELGFVGLLLVIWLGYRVISVGKRGVSRQNSSHSGIIVFCIVAAVVGIAVNGFFSFPFQNAVPPLILMVFLAVLGWYANPRAREQRSATISSLKWIYSFVGFTLLLLSVGIFVQGRRLRGDHFLLEGIRHENARDWEQAVSAGEASYSYNRYPVGLRFRLGQYYIEVGRYRKAIEMIGSGLKSHPYYATGFYNLGVAHFRLQEHQKALANFKKAIEIYPDLDQAHSMMGATLLELGELGEAEASLRLALSQNPKNPSYYFNLGRVFLRQNRFPEASRSLEIAVAADPANPAFQLVKGMAEQARGLLEEAVDRYRTAVELKPEWDEANMRLGSMLLRLGEREEGTVFLTKALQLNPNASWASQVAATLESNNRDPKPANIE